MGEKQKVISVLRALLLSNRKKDGMPLRELKQDFSFHEGKREIPLFEHNSVIDFLISSGEFILNTDHNGLVMVREKPKLLHNKSLTTEPKAADSSCSNEDSTSDMVIAKIKTEPPSCNDMALTGEKSSTEDLVRCHSTTKLNLKTNSKKSPEHMSKPSTVFTFEQLNGSRQKETLNNLFEQNSNLMENSGDQALRVNASRNDIQILQTAFSGDELQKDEERALQITPGASGQSYTDKSKSSFSKLNGMCISFYKNLTCDAHKTYTAMLKIDSVNYFGSGKTSEEANEIAASSYFKSMQSGTHQQLKKIRKPLNDSEPSSSFNVLSEMYAGLHYHTIGRDENSMYRAVVQVDSVNYYGDGINFQSAANKAADTCLKSINCGRHTKLVNK